MSDTFDLYKKKTIKHLAENVLSRIDVVNSSGLYNGKAGIAIGLFEAAKFLNDTSIEDKAFRLFQESLIIKNRDLSFENGLPGIGYTLLYMIENEFIETDFIEIFEEEYELIIKRYIEIEKEPSRLLSSFKAIYFFRKAVEITKDDRIKKIIRKFFEGLELYLAIHFLDFSDKLYINNKFFVLKVYEQYLRLIDFTTYTDFSKLVMDSYSQLYKKGKISSNYFTGFFLENITNGNNEYADIIQQNKQYGLLAFHSDSLFLNEQIDLLCCIYKDKCNEKETITKAVEKEWINLLPKNPWDIIYFRIPSNSQNIGYGFGLSRLLTFVTNKNHCFV